MVLTKARIAHAVYVGSLTDTTTGKTINWHMWLRLSKPAAIVNYRARMWLGNRQNIPHGIFQLDEYPVLYDGEVIEVTPFSDALFQVLTAGS